MRGKQPIKIARIGKSSARWRWQMGRERGGWGRGLQGCRKWRGALKIDQKVRVSSDFSVCGTRVAECQESSPTFCTVRGTGCGVLSATSGGEAEGGWGAVNWRDRRVAATASRVSLVNVKCCKRFLADFLSLSSLSLWLFLLLLLISLLLLLCCYCYADGLTVHIAAPAAALSLAPPAADRQPTGQSADDSSLSPD